MKNMYVEVWCVKPVSPLISYTVSCILSGSRCLLSWQHKEDVYDVDVTTTKKRIVVVLHFSILRWLWGKRKMNICDNVMWNLLYLVHTDLRFTPSPRKYVCVCLDVWMCVWMYLRGIWVCVTVWSCVFWCLYVDMTLLQFKFYFFLFFFHHIIFKVTFMTKPSHDSSQLTHRWHHRTLVPKVLYFLIS